MEELLQLLLYVSIHGFLIAFFLAFKKVEGAVRGQHRLLSVILTLFSLYLLEYYLVSKGHWPRSLNLTTYPALFFIPALLFRYQQMTTGVSPLKWKYILLPGVLCYALFTPFYIFNSTEEAVFCPFATMQLAGLDYLRPITSDKVHFGHGLIWLLMAGVDQYRGHFMIKPVAEKVPTGTFWLRIVFVLLTLYYLMGFITAAQSANWSEYPLFRLLHFVLLALMIQSFGYWLSFGKNSQSLYLPRPSARLYNRSGMNQSMTHVLGKEINHYMEQKRVYRDSKLSLQQLADLLQVPRNNVSRAINETEGETFFNFINGYRIREAKERLSDPGNQDRIMDIGFAVGFSNKVTFYRAFKKATGLSPSAFRKAHAGMKMR